MKIEQIAFTNYPGSEQWLQYFFGKTDWVRDEATGVAWVYGMLLDAPITAELAFTDNNGIQFELLQYKEGHTNWIDERTGGRLAYPVLSHLGYHVSDVITEMARFPFPVAQVMVTFHHTNPFLVNNKRTYIYAVLDSNEELGFDLKLIQRVDNQIQPTDTEEKARKVLDRILASGMVQ